MCLPGVEQAANSEGPGARHAAQTSRVDAGAGVQASSNNPESPGRSDSNPAPDRAHQPAGIQQEEGEGVEAQTCHGGPTAAQESEGSQFYYLSINALMLLLKKYKNKS